MAGRLVLGMPALYPEDYLWHARFNGRRQAALVGRDAGEPNGVEADVRGGRDNHGRDQGYCRLETETT